MQVGGVCCQLMRPMVQHLPDQNVGFIACLH
jgi:hypothetical protein